ncbi:hypothetical protein GUJ93_ZPchr0004g38696 [Zizania palustris]|uniref:Uncharacterized protein n=1 Tax=Zizania palustris TaxID=103762 RepID=A0A8J5T067_ZIZPA|nr:hypothetical protein GUJ93_ZPchr0004g38696 [Zizania palustris]
MELRNVAFNDGYIDIPEYVGVFPNIGDKTCVVILTLDSHNADLPLLHFTTEGDGFDHAFQEVALQAIAELSRQHNLHLYRAHFLYYTSREDG